MFYINIFFIYSFIGFLFESFLRLFGISHFNSGVLYGPWTFIYGIAIFIIMFLNYVIKNLNLKKWQELLLFFLFSTIIMTSIELIGGILIEKIGHVIYWDYTNMAFNFGHYICLEASLFWGLFATIINYLVHPFILKFEEKIPIYITIIFIIGFLIDIVVTIFN